MDAFGHVHRAVPGLLTDGVSNPRFGWRVLGAPFSNRTLPAGVIHDHYCDEAESLPIGPERHQLRLEGDRLLRFMAATSLLDVRAPRDDQKIAQLRPAVMYRGVRVGAFASRKAPRLPNYVHEQENYWAAKGVPGAVCREALRKGRLAV